MPLISRSVEDLPVGTIVVGHDGSGDSRTALSEAITLAEALGVGVTVLRAFNLATELRTQQWTGYVPTSDELSPAIEEALRSELEPIATEHDELDIGFCVSASAPARALVAASEQARYVVVGSRGRGGFAAMVLGSVTDAVVRYAQCPVLVTCDNTA